MKLDTSEYYPKSPLDDDPELKETSDVRDTEEHFEEASENTEEASETIAVLTPPVQEREITEAEHGHEPKLKPEAGPDKALESVATAVSWVFAPLLMPVYGILLIFGLSVLDFVPDNVKVAFTLIIAAVNVLIPAVMVLILKRMDIVQDLGLNDRKERFIPYVITILCMGGTAWFLAAKQFPMWAVMFYTGGAVAGLVEMIVNFRWKISAHAAGIAGIVALLIRLSHEPFFLPQLETWLIISIGVAGLVGSARLLLKRHTLPQILAGYAVGFCAVYFMSLI